MSKQRRQNLDAKSVSGKFVGYCHEGDGYRVYLPSSKTIVRSRDVIFSKNEVSSMEQDIVEKVQLETEENVSNDETVTRSQRHAKTPHYLDDYELYLAENIAPLSYKEAIKSPDAKEWEEAMRNEMNSLKENQVWTLVELPKGKKVLGSRWVLRVKLNPDGSVNRYKARLCAQGFNQKWGIDYCETFSPVARYDTVRAVLSVAAKENLHLKQFDVQTAFLYGRLEEEVYIKQPEGFEDGTGRVCRLQRSLYGLKQSPRCWNERLVNFLKHMGLIQSSADPCLFSRVKENKRLLVAVYVDDGVVA